MLGTLESAIPQALKVEQANILACYFGVVKMRYDLLMIRERQVWRMSILRGTRLLRSKQRTHTDAPMTSYLGCCTNGKDHDRIGKGILSLARLIRLTA